MSEDQRIYSDNEFAIILRKATELSSRPERLASSSPSTGLTLHEMKAAASEAGIDPALIERAARMLPTTTVLSPLERLIGGPMRHEQVAQFPISLDENRAARLLSAARISAGAGGGAVAGHSSTLGVTWNDGSELDALSVTARSGKDGTEVLVAVDRQSTIAASAVFSVIGMVAAGIAGVAMSELSPLLGLGASAVVAGGVLAGARRYWSTTTRQLHERVMDVMEGIVPVLASPEQDRANAKGEE